MNTLISKKTFFNRLAAGRYDRRLAEMLTHPDAWVREAAVQRLKAIRSGT